MRELGLHGQGAGKASKFTPRPSEERAHIGRLSASSFCTCITAWFLVHGSASSPLSRTLLRRGQPPVTRITCISVHVPMSDPAGRMVNPLVTLPGNREDLRWRANPKVAEAVARNRAAAAALRRTSSSGSQTARSGGSRGAAAGSRTARTDRSVVIEGPWQVNGRTCET